jgi:DNA-binding MarR family transcriptional regulator
MQKFFQVTAPAIHSMILTLESRGLIARTPGEARSIRVVVRSEDLPVLRAPADEKAGGAA